MQQINKTEFSKALMELGHDPSDYEGKRLSLSSMCELYELSQETILDAIDQDLVSAHYDYKNDTIWIDALEAAHFFYCFRNTQKLSGF
jgi:hypothetical protein